jgi:hypothetical protein
VGHPGVHVHLVTVDGHQQLELAQGAKENGKFARVLQLEEENLGEAIRLAESYKKSPSPASSAPSPK